MRREAGNKVKWNDPVWWLLILHHELKRNKKVLADMYIWHFFKWKAWKNCFRFVSWRGRYHLPGSYVYVLFCSGPCSSHRELISSHFCMTWCSHLGATPDARPLTFQCGASSWPRRIKSNWKFWVWYWVVWLWRSHLGGGPAPPLMQESLVSLCSQWWAELLEGRNLWEQSGLNQGIWTIKNLLKSLWKRYKRDFSSTGSTGEDRQVYGSVGLFFCSMSLLSGVTGIWSLSWAGMFKKLNSYRSN